MKNFKKRLNKKHKRVSDDLFSFIQQNDNNINKITNSIQVKQNQIEGSLSTAETEFNSIYEQAHSNFNSLEVKLRLLTKMFEEVNSNQTKSFDNLKEKVDFKQIYF